MGPQPSPPLSPDPAATGRHSPPGRTISPPEPPDPSAGQARRAAALAPWAALLRACREPAPWPRRRRALAEAWADLTRRQAQLELWTGDVCSRRLPLGDERLRIGRDPLCELPVEAAGVSRIHAVLEREHPGDRNHRLEDFHATNGLFWRDRRIRAIALRHGDRVLLGSPLKGPATPSLRYSHPRSPLEAAIHGLGLFALAGSAVVVGGLLLVSSVAGGSTIRFYGGPLKILAADFRRIDAREGAATALPSLADYPQPLQQALLASEDARFGWNSGLDLFGTLRALVQGSGGGSGLTQQVARLYDPAVGHAVSMDRKLRELWVAWQLETAFSKNRILKMYLDRAPLGLGSEGFEQAAQLYFRKSARQLDLAESAFLVGLLPSPNGYSPCNAPQPTSGALDTWAPVQRRNLVLRRMHEEGFIGQDALRDAQRRPLNIDPSACGGVSAYRSHPFFADYVRGELQGRRFGLNLDPERGGGNYAVISTINPRLQQLAETELRRFIDRQAEPLGISQAALISLDLRSGDILAYVGGRDYGRSGYDRVQALRQPGSTFKLFSFLAALARGIEPGERISCAPLGAVAGCGHGPVDADGSTDMASGFARSENVVALRLADRVGLDTVIAQARRLGISTPLRPDHNMVLGGDATYLYELARAYAVVANGGRSVPMHGVRRIIDLGLCPGGADGADCPAQAISDPVGETPRQLLDPAIAARMDGLLRLVVSEGTGRAAGVIADARGKTGTTNDGVDVLFIGYSPAAGILTAVWMGNDDNRPAEAATSVLATEVWARFMGAALG
jgi:peptidoglycan glycosyltransferase